MLFRSNDTATTEIYTLLYIFPYTTLFRSRAPRVADHVLRGAVLREKDRKAGVFQTDAPKVGRIARHRMRP